MLDKGHSFNNYFGHHVAVKESFIGALGQAHRLSAKEFNLIFKVEYKSATMKRSGGTGVQKRYLIIFFSK
jgi:hypothetical protein